MTKRKIGILAAVVLLLTFMIPAGIFAQQTNGVTKVESPIWYKTLKKEDIQRNRKILQWYEKNYQTKGVHFLKFGWRTYVLASAGEKPTGGYSIDVESATMVSPGNAYITARVSGHEPDAMVTQALTYPHVLIRLEAKRIKQVQGDIADDTLQDDPAQAVDKTIKDIGAAISARDIKSIELFSLMGDKIKDFDKKEIGELVGYYNKSGISDAPMLMMIAGNTMLITLKDGSTIRISSYGSKTHVVASREIKGQYTTYHLVCPEIAAILLSDET